jgi:hypothetical protein
MQGTVAEPLRLMEMTPGGVGVAEGELVEVAIAVGVSVAVGLSVGVKLESIMMIVPVTLTSLSASRW